MAATRLKNDEDALTRSLREIASFGQNKFCFDCSQRGPTYVNMTIGSFVCTSCSGHLRGLNPPHRVKSISMASFTTEEIDFIRSRGNEFCSKVWGPPIDDVANQVVAGDSGRVTLLMSHKYEQKRWYTKPTDEMYAEARRANLVSTGPQAGVGTTTVTGLSKPIYQMSGSQSVPNIQGMVLSVQRPSPSVNRTTSISANTAPVMRQVSVTSPSASSSSQSWQDPFAGAPQPHLADASFANFANFSSAPSGSPSYHQQLPAHATTAPQGGSAFVSNEFQRFSALPFVASSNDKYAALANVNNADGTINWHGNAFSHESDSRPSGDQFITSMFQHFTERNSSDQMIRQPTSTVVNPFSSIPVTASPFFNPSPYVLLQTGARTCYMPAAVYVTGQFSGASVAPAAVYASAAPVVPFNNQFVSQTPLHYASNPFLNISQSTSSVRRDVTNPFL